MYYFIHMVGCIEPTLYGPFPTDEERDNRAWEFHRDSNQFDPEDDVLFWLDQNEHLRVGSYTAEFFSYGR